MTRFVVGDDRSQSTLFPERLDDYLGEDSPVRAIDVFVDQLDMAGLGLCGKWLETLREAAPTTTRVLVLLHPETTAHKEFFRAIEGLAGPLKIEVTAAGIHNSTEVESALAEFAANGSGVGIIALPHAITEINRDLIIQ